MKKVLSLTILSILLLSACGATKTEKERFIDATTEVTCLVFNSGDLLDPALEQKTKDVFEKHGFDVKDEQAMVDIASRYENDADVSKAVQDALKECASDYLNSAAATTTPPTGTDTAQPTTSADKDTTTSTETDKK